MTDSTNNFISNFKNLHERGLAFARAFVFDADLAEDITSEAMIVLWNKLRGGQHIEQPQIYLFAIIRNKALESLRNCKTALLARNELSLASERDYNLRIKSAEACDPQILYSKEVQAIIKSGAMGIDICAIRQPTDNKHIGKEMRQLATNVINHIVAVSGAVACAYNADYVACVKIGHTAKI